MKKIVLYYFLSCIFWTAACSQEKKIDFKINFGLGKVPKSYYKHIQFLDSREDTTNFGTVFLDHGFGDRKRTVIASPVLSTQLSNLIDSLTDSTAQNSTLLFQLRNLYFIQTVGGTYSKRYCCLRAYLYSQKDSFFERVCSIDTTIVTKSYNATRKLLSDADLTIQAFIADNLVKLPNASSSYSLAELQKIDSIEKSKLFVYTATKFTDGGYLTYRSFASQAPDMQIIAKTEGDKLIYAKQIDSTGNAISVKGKNIYAVIYNGQSYISTPYGYCKLNKVNNDFVFVGRAKAAPNSEDVMAATFAFGVIGGILASNVTGTFEMKIDYVDGRVIILRQLKDASE